MSCGQAQLVQSHFQRQPSIAPGEKTRRAFCPAAFSVCFAAQSKSAFSSASSRIFGAFPRGVASKQQQIVLGSDEALPEMLHYYRRPFLSSNATAQLLRKVQSDVSGEVLSIDTEQCYNISLKAPLSEAKLKHLKWLLQETFEPENLLSTSSLSEKSDRAILLEFGPRLSFTTAWSANALSIFKSCDLQEIDRIERSRRYLLNLSPGTSPLDELQINKFSSMVHDRMTETVYPTPLSTFKINVVPEPIYFIPVMEKGRLALEEINKSMGLAFDEDDLKYYTKLFQVDIKRNPTNVELFDIAQSNSEHSRHWFFKGELVIDGRAMPKSLMELVADTLKANRNNSVIGFKDNSSAIRGFRAEVLLPSRPGIPCVIVPVTRDLCILFTAETHNFPCAVAPFPGAETGAGGRIRDTHATGIGSLVVASTAGYCVGNLQLEGTFAPWEDSSFAYPPNLAPPLQILIDASNGASDYGNKFGEPLIQGYTRTFGMRLPNGERREWLKPIMFSGGIGQIDEKHLKKEDPDLGMLVVKVGGPAYRIGMGGGAASSMVSGQNDAELDFNAVQRGDAEMAQKLYRVIRTCVEMGDGNPIVSIHDQGAGGNCNVVKEIIYPKGATIDIRSIVVGDETMSVLEIWGAEYQEQDALLIRPESEALLQSICDRERVSMAVIGKISGEGKIVLIDSAAQKLAEANNVSPPPPAVDLDLEKVLGDMPRKTFTFDRKPVTCEPLDITPGVSVRDALRRVLSLPSVCSKRFLTTKVDRCVTGLVAQQQTVGPLQLPLADVAVIAQSHLDLTGAACAIGEQPTKGLLNPAAMARVALGEALTNLVWAKVTALKDVKASGNWMYAAKLDSEGADMYDAAVALRDAMIELEVAIDGGKDSLSMAAQAGGETVKAPGNLVISAYVTCPDITLTVTPDLKLGDEGVLLHINVGSGKGRLGGSALAQAFDQIGDTCPDVNAQYLKRAFNATQDLIGKKLISAGHDISDGGVIVSLLEMSFAGNCGIEVDIPASEPDTAAFSALFSEELGLIYEVHRGNLGKVIEVLHSHGVVCEVLGRVRSEPTVKLSVNGKLYLDEPTASLRDTWEETSFALEKQQCLESCVKAEQEGLSSRTTPLWNLPSLPTKINKQALMSTKKHKVAVIREEGSNGDREMAAMVYCAGFDPWDVSMSDLRDGKVSLSDFRGLVFVGGFSYGDVLDSAKGWAGTIRFNKSLLDEFQKFYDRPDTFSLGVCNGCQLMALLGWVPGVKDVGGDKSQPRFVHNESGRFECRFASVTIEQSPAIMLKGMEGTTVGIWVANGEGRAFFPQPEILTEVLDSNLAPLRYCDDAGEVTEQYPFNPNGSPRGVAALCSPDGRHLAMMPHPERCFMMWQFPWYPREWQIDPAGPSPWLKLFENARNWCQN
ncbi:probable phosphoribosylformylglycinamidine synthase, chloroplastic/mitochondrial [Selaginella moellendorffii]|uniref:probable phosphoribosylformylglycinamidine synthase, chloroplastic/mitochondrial n=1 Tax=Selaginella moellendorffii TaxID=88036 RepID=UPI000D1CC99E|nr:probable phosphoribosylformylglycinamidine synthase, chloroplastic/mitochondrial [Selaginella moellendorffii]|eukprot:XP_024542306.1 probable phosphoribosylformylglycinamidine synthase, chloroplastic/mitochondrial [Selaginella moellendorffii]